MCLYTLDKEPKIAEEDIVCYKVLTCGVDGDFHPLIHTPYKIKLVPDKAEGMTPDETGTPVITKHNYGMNTIYGVKEGYIHTYTYIEEEFAVLHYNDMRVMVKKCIIPKGAEYYVGHTNWYNADVGLINCYASKSIKFVEPIDYEKDYIAGNTDRVTRVCEKTFTIGGVKIVKGNKYEIVRLSYRLCLIIWEDNKKNTKSVQTTIDNIYMYFK